MTASPAQQLRSNAADMAVLASRFDGVARAMTNTLVRTGRSGVLNTGRDFSCCILAADASLVTMAESLPIHVMSGPDLMAKTMTQFHPELRRGDAFLHNSPYHGNSHAADYSVLVPVIDDEGVHRFTVFAKAHQADCGNSEPTTYFATARDVYAEGALLFPCVAVQRDYHDIDDIIRMCKLRIRVPEQWWGDYLALLGAVRVGEQRIMELGNEFGWDALELHVRDWLDYSEGQMAEAIRALPAGTVTATSTHDPFPGAEDGVVVSATVAVDRDEGRITVDLRDNVDCLPCGLNLTEATARAAASIGVLNSLHTEVPTNGGALRRLDIQLRENCAVGIPSHPASCSVATSNLSDRVVNAVQTGLAQLGDHCGMAEAGLPQTPAWGVISGTDARTGDRFVNELVLAAVTGGPAGPRADGWLTYGHSGAAGGVLRDSIELDELRYPVHIAAQYVVIDSEGAGRRRGAPSAFAEYGPVGAPFDVMYNSDGCVHPARGVNGGSDGGRASQELHDLDGTTAALPPTGRVSLRPGQTIASVSCGGGGYGDPLDREPERVALDVELGFVSRHRALHTYGVVLDDLGAVDATATAAHRQERRASLKGDS